VKVLHFYSSAVNITFPLHACTCGGTLRAGAE